MYDPLALDRQRIELERLRRRTETAPRRPDYPSTGDTSRGHGEGWLRSRRSHRRPAAAC